MGAGLTVVSSLAVLLSGFRSVSLAVTLAVLVMVPVVVGWTTIVTVAAAPPNMPPRLAVTTPPDWLTDPWLVVAETNVTPAGRESVATTPVASLGPLLVIVRV